MHWNPQDTQDLKLPLIFHSHHLLPLSWFDWCSKSSNRSSRILVLNTTGKWYRVFVYDGHEWMRKKEFLAAIAGQAFSLIWRVRHSGPVLYSSAQRYGTKSYDKIVSVIPQTIYLILIEGQELFLNV